MGVTADCPVAREPDFHLLGQKVLESTEQAGVLETKTPRLRLVTLFLKEVTQQGWNPCCWAPEPTLSTLP